MSSYSLWHYIHLILLEQVLTTLSTDSEVLSFIKVGIVGFQSCYYVRAEQMDPQLQWSSKLCCIHCFVSLWYTYFLSFVWTLVSWKSALSTIGPFPRSLISVLKCMVLSGSPHLIFCLDQKVAVHSHSQHFSFLGTFWPVTIVCLPPYTGFFSLLSFLSKAFWKVHINYVS